MSYYADARVRAMGPRPYTWEVDGNKVIVTLCEAIAEALGDDADATVTMPLHYRVCPLCSGKGTVVNPSIDCDGITASDFREDPYFAREYFSGMYDIACPKCGGLRVVPEITLPEHVQNAVEEWEREEAAFQRECAMERRYGA